MSNQPFDPHDAAKLHDDEDSLMNFDEMELEKNVVMIPGERMLFFDSNGQKIAYCSDKHTKIHTKIHTPSHKIQMKILNKEFLIHNFKQPA